MRFGREGATAAELLAEIGEEELVRVLREFGEEPRARRVARAITRARLRQPIRTTGELHGIVRAALGTGRSRIDPATRTFQALRIATNRELESIPSAMDQAARLLRPGGRLAVIAFHSLEDRLVKRALRRLSGRCVCPPGTFACQCHPERLLEILTPKPVTPGPEELAANPRARSAKLRVAARRSG
jgi:16S rRNA (cytosine1402-N4)-methyltransferase